MGRTLSHPEPALLISLAPLADADPADIEALLDAAFGTDRHERTAYKLRTGMAAIPDLSVAAFEGERLVGTLQCWPVALHGQDGETPLILVGPVAVAPDRQQQGIGRALMDVMLSRTKNREPLILIGDPEYYGRHFGFVADATSGWTLPGPYEPRRLLAHAGGRALPGEGEIGPRRETMGSFLR